MPMGEALMPLCEPATPLFPIIPPGYAGPPMPLCEPATPLFPIIPPGYAGPPMPLCEPVTPLFPIIPPGYPWPPMPMREPPMPLFPIIPPGYAGRPMPVPPIPPIPLRYPPALLIPRWNPPREPPRCWASAEETHSARKQPESKTVVVVDFVEFLIVVDSRFRMLLGVWSLTLRHAWSPGADSKPERYQAGAPLAHSASFHVYYSTPGTRPRLTADIRELAER